MGTSITDWEAVEGAFYAGAYSSEVLWFLIALGLTILPLVLGQKHEKKSYEKLKK